MTSNAFTPIGTPFPQGLGEDPLFHFTKAYCLFLQGLMRQLPEGSYRWSDDEEKTEIVITDQAPFPRQRIGQRPAIICLRGPEQFGNLSLDNLRQLNWRTGEKERTDLVACSMSICCIAKMGLEAQRIAWLVQSSLRNHKEMLQREAYFHKIGDEVSGSPESPPGAVVAGESDSEAVMVTVQSPFYFQWTVRTTPQDNVLLRDIQVRLRAGLVPPEGLTTRARQCSIRMPTLQGKPIGVSHPIDQTLKI